jgi:putative oxidoreductase
MGELAHHDPEKLQTILLMLKRLLTSAPYSLDWAALIMRFAFCGLLLYNHGLIKMQLFSEDPSGFPNPINIGAQNTYYAVLFAEVICAVLVLLGLFTRLASLPILATLFLAVFSVHAENPLVDKELPLLYLVVYVAIFLLGPGKFSLDARLKMKDGD